jgi:hypothetical protein
MEKEKQGGFEILKLRLVTSRGDMKYPSTFKGAGSASGAIVKLVFVF